MIKLGLGKTKGMIKDKVRRVMYDSKYLYMLCYIFHHYSYYNIEQIYSLSYNI